MSVSVNITKVDLSNIHHSNMHSNNMFKQCDSSLGGESIYSFVLRIILIAIMHYKTSIEDIAKDLKEFMMEYQLDITTLWNEANDLWDMGQGGTYNNKTYIDAIGWDITHRITSLLKAILIACDTPYKSDSILHEIVLHN